ncbi:MAG: sulfotransferase [Gammaproteobacteria bacterium]|nr:sulfotransferase [Gammaproteobacteria bacterium]
MLPTFIIAGERRSGTTSLYSALQVHPEINLYPKSELNYFVEQELSGRQWIDGEPDSARWEETHSIEEYSTLFSDGGAGTAVGHKGADLLFWKPAQTRMMRYAPNARILITLRNPVNRAWSHYWNEVGKGRETLEFDNALQQEQQRSARSAFARFHLSYRARGFYADSLRSFFKVVPREQVLVVTLEESRIHRRDTLGRIYTHLGVNPELGLEGGEQRRNVNWTTVPRPWTRNPLVRPLASAYTALVHAIATPLTRTKEQRHNLRRLLKTPVRHPASGILMPEETRIRLTELYAPGIEALEELLGRSLKEWKY